MKVRLLALALVAACLVASLPAAAVDLPEGYRTPPYRGATPSHVPGATTVETADVLALRDAGAVLIDVTPLTLGRVGAMAGRWVVTAPHETLPGAHWLPNVGEAAPSPQIEAWFRLTLDDVTRGDAGVPLVFFCQADCWMSWNAAKRAIAWGYRAVAWYRGGLDAWRLSLEPMETAHPRPLR